MTKKKTPPAPLPFRILRAVFPTLENVTPWLAKRIVVRLFFSPFRFKPRQAEEEMQSTGERIDYTVNGNRVVTYVWGEGHKTAILVHGWSGRGMQLRRYIDPLVKQGYQVVSFDAPGHGQSEGKDSSLLEFHATLMEIEKRYGPISLGVGHSLGGAALIYAAKEGMKFDKLVTLGTPTLPEKIVEEYLNRINGSPKMDKAIDEYVIQRTGNNFAYYSAIVNAPQIENIPLLSFHDENDQDAGIEHARAMSESRNNMQLIETKGLGHNRILKDEAVKKKMLEFSDFSEHAVAG